MEPRTSTPARRLDAIAKLSGAGIPVGVMLAPVIPGLTDHEIPSILQAARLAGAVMAAYVPLRLPFAVKDLFENWLSEHFPDRKDKILNRIRSMRNGKLNDSTFHTRMRGHGPWAEQLRTLFSVARRKAGFPDAELNLRKDLFRLPPGPQMMLWS
jgi:DNA repair photolyase